MTDYNKMPAEMLGEGSTIKLERCETEVDLYWRVAMDVLSVIEENNKKGEPTIMVVPYGPLGPYARIVYLVNKYRISLKNCTFINMDEYLDDNDEYLDKA
ncbi:MAG: glucosamine-6-phosphate isomerase, partial [Clostridia bacterium]|nr:glucosamine-6-phosphate isomerase [Clostridia bacterium]